MWRIKYWLTVIVVVTIPRSTNCLITSATKTATRDILIQHAVKQLLGVGSSPSSSSANTSASSSSVSSAQAIGNAPHYMLDLYERYQNGDLRGTHGSNTVRSIVAYRGSLKGDDVLFFNLSGIHRTEDILHAELHFYRRRRRRSTIVDGSPIKDRHRNQRLRVQLLAVENGRHQRLTSVEVPKLPMTSGWLSSDVTNGVLGMMSRTRGDGGAANIIMAAKFETTSGGKKAAGGGKNHFRSLPVKKLMMTSNQPPFLIVFSNDTVALLDDDMGADELDEDGDGIVDDDYDFEANGFNSSDALMQLTRKRRGVSHKRIRKYNIENGDDDNENSNDIDEADYYLKSNELPEKRKHVVDQLFRHRHSNRVPISHPGVLSPRLQPQQNGRRRTSAATSSILPIPAKMRQKQQSSTLRKQRWKQDMDNDAIVDEPDATLDEGDDEDDSAPCRRRKLVVEFSDIGWGEWIISPKSFDAHYCAGTCPFPLTKSVRPSNHATIQSLVHAVGGKRHPGSPDGKRTAVPPPCCVPDSMSSVTLLYFDEDRNVVLKNYPAMTVESCACR